MGDQGERLASGRTAHLATTYAISLPAVEAGFGLAMAHGAVADNVIKDDRLVRPFRAVAFGAMREKQAESHRGSRRRLAGPLHKAGYPSAIETADRKPNRLLRSGGGHICP